MLDEPSTWWQVWQQVRAASLTPEQLGLAADEAPLRPAALRRHLAAQLGRPRGLYARCVAGLEDVWIARMDKTLHPGEGQ